MSRRTVGQLSRRSDAGAAQFCECGGLLAEDAWGRVFCLDCEPVPPPTPPRIPAGGRGRTR